MPDDDKIKLRAFLMKGITTIVLFSFTTAAFTLTHSFICYLLIETLPSQYQSGILLVAWCVVLGFFVSIHLKLLDILTSYDKEPGDA